MRISDWSSDVCSSDLVTQVGLDFLAAAFAYGAEQVVFLANPKKRDELGGLAGQIGLAETVLSGLGYGEGRLHLIDDADPDAVEATLYGLAAPAAPHQRSDEHKSELQPLMRYSYEVLCL